MGKNTNLIVLILAGVLASPCALGKEKKAAKEEASDLFGLTKLWTIRVDVSADDFMAMQPVQKARLGARRVQQQQPNEKDKVEAGRLEPSPFGYEYRYVPATLVFGDRRFEKTGVRFKGNSSYLLSRGGIKKPFKVDFNRYVKGQKLDGLTQINLHNNTLDPAQIREAMSYWVFRQAGLPAPRTAFAEVYFTVPGRYDRKWLGLYTIVEEVNKPFLKAHFGSSEGLLLKPEGLMQGLTYLGEDWRAYERRYRPKTEATPEAKRRLIELTRLIDKADDDTFRKQIGDYLDVDEFLRFIAVTQLLGNLDSYLTTGHNYYLYLPPEGRFHFIPWDLNLSFAGFQMVAGVDVLEDLSIAHPYGGENRLIQRVLAVKAFDASYRRQFRELVAGAYKPEHVDAAIDEVNNALGAILKKEADTPELETSNLWLQAAISRIPQLKPFVTARVASVTAQLDGKSQGKPPASFQSRQGIFGGRVFNFLRRAAEANVDKDGRIRLPGQRPATRPAR